MRECRPLSIILCDINVNWRTLFAAKDICSPPADICSPLADICSPLADIIRGEHCSPMFAADNIRLRRTFVRRRRTLFAANIGEHVRGEQILANNSSRRTNVRQELAELFACSPRVRREPARIRANPREFADVRRRTSAGSPEFFLADSAANTGEQLFAARSAKSMIIGT